MKSKKFIESFEIWTDKLVKIYGKGENALEAVSEIDLRIEPGIYGFLGPNGAGKTTTMSMLVGAISITSGLAKIRGNKAGSIQAKQLIGFLPQDPVFYNNMTGQDYIKLMGELGGLKPPEAKKKAQELLDYFDMFDDRNRKIKEYSGGMKQKIGIAAALVHEPSILILDEPTANLDPLGRADVIDKIKKLGKDVSVFVSSHILSEIEQMCDKVTMIDRGKIVISDEIRNIKKKYVGNIFVVDTNMNEKILNEIIKKKFVSKAWIVPETGKIHIIPNNQEDLREYIPKLIIEKNATLYNFSQPELSLQDIFMEIMSDRRGKKNEK